MQADGSDEGTSKLRPIRRTEVHKATKLLNQRTRTTPALRILRHKLALKRSTIAPKNKDDINPVVTLDSLPAPPQPTPPPVIPDITITPYENSFASRMYGLRTTSWHSPDEESCAVLYRDWETEPPWLKLLADIRHFHRIKHPERACGLDEETVAPIDYLSLHRDHLPQVHDLLARTFWPGIDVTSAAAPENSPRKYTVVAMYKKLIVGAAFISPPPNDAYITYVSVRAGWEFSRIGLTMLYHLITQSADRDIILHVSSNSTAMLLYNKIGFKAEEFVVGFYEDYMDARSKASTNAIKLRLRQQ